MAVDPNQDEEKKSYSALYLVVIALLLAGSIWAVWDDNIFRRPWKQYQSQFFDIEHEAVKAEIAKEEERLAADPKFQEVSKKLAEATASVQSGEKAAKIAELQRELKTAETRELEWDLSIRIVKSEIEASKYEYEHAVELGGSGEEERKHLEEKEAEKAELDKGYADAQAKRAAIEEEIKAIQSEVKQLDDELREVTKDRERLVQRLEGMTINFNMPFGTVSFPPVPKIQQTVLNEYERNNFDKPIERVDRCMSCHAGIDKAGFDDQPNPFKTHPDRAVLLAAHPVEKLGCTPCHNGQGPAVNSPKVGHGEVMFWEHPLLRGEKVQSSCLSCHGDVARLPHADRIAHGERLFEQLGCHGCHLVEGYDGLDKVAPRLTTVAAKSDPQWMVNWIENPQAFRPRSKMPWFLFNKEQSEQVTAYLLSVSKEAGDQWLAAQAEPAGVDPANADLVAKGKALAESVGCHACHAFAPDQVASQLSEGKDVAPNLSRVAEKTSARWIYNWIKNPRAYDPDTRMPNLRLTDEEASAITSYLLTLRQETPEPDAGLAERLAKPEAIEGGKKLIRKYGCAGCHVIPGMENESRVGVELTLFGSKTLEELFFGNHQEIPRTWDDWTFHKLKDPRIYETEFIEQAMPNFRLTDDEAAALRLFLMGRVEQKVPAKYRVPDPDGREARLVRGRRLAQEYNCIGCHVIADKGGTVRQFYKDNPTMAPPILNGEGKKVQGKWLFAFLKNPVPIRPWLSIRMPTFGLRDDEAQDIVAYFQALDDMKNPLQYFDMAKVPPEHIEAAKTMFSPDYFACFSCHQQGEQKPEGPPEGWAPDLAMANERLNPEWVVEWIHDPQKIMPGTKMPSFYPGGPDDVLGGDETKQIQALRDYIFSLGRKGGGAVSQAAAAKPATPAQPAG